jgi:uncharacterized membrane protein
MTNELNEQVRKIVDNYLGRLRAHLEGLPEQDREELVREIYSHIYDSYHQDDTEDEVQRILVVLERLGEPSEVVSSRLSESMTTMGKKRNLPLLILAGFFIGLFGLPLGIGGIAVLIGLGVTLAALIFTYFVCAGAFVLAGWLSVVVTTVRLFSPDFLKPYVNLTDQFLDPALAVPLNYAGGVFLLLLGAFMIWQGQHVLRGGRYLFSLPGQSIRHLRKKRWFAAAEKRGRETVASNGIR